MMNVSLKAGTLYVLSAPPGAGKSTMLERSKEFLPTSAVVSSDALREQLLGTLTDASGLKHYFAHADREVFELLEKIVRTRVKEGLTTIVDATSVDDSERAAYAKIAKEAGVPFEVLILDVDLEIAKARNQQRAARVPEHRIEDFFKRFQKSSKHPHRLIPSDSVLKVEAVQLPHSRVDVIGDVHGLLDDLLKLLEKAGWVLENGVPHHPDGRLMLFLGDLVDRGPQSIEVLKFVRKAVAAGSALAIQGNHEAKLVRFWHMMQGAGTTSWSSFANAETGANLLKLHRNEAQTLVEFMHSLPKSYTWEKGAFKVAFCHADQSIFHPTASPKSDLLYGVSRYKDGFDSDKAYQANYDNGTNTHVLIRGHIEQTSEQDSVFSLERRQVYKGQLVLLQLDKFLSLGAKGDRRAAFNQSLVLQNCDFDFEAYAKRYELARAMDRLVGDKLATRAEEAGSGLRLYKYSKRVFYDALWGASDYLLKARGLVLDIAGNIVAHPFDKVFNYRENGAGEDLPDSTRVVAVEKMNGFLGVITKHPFKNELLITTQGSFTSDFVGYIRSLINPSLYASMLRYLSKNPVTLMFEVIHPDDPHIIEYGAEKHGLWLLGVRTNKEQELAWPEHEVDKVAQEVGLPRPKWEVTTLGELKAKLKTSKLEGYMVREFSREELHIFKWKTPYYLTTKFVGRLSNGKLEHLYGNPKDFKQKLDEEFYPLVDMLVNEVPKSVIQEAPEAERVSLVRELVHRIVM